MQLTNLLARIKKKNKILNLNNFLKILASNKYCFRCRRFSSSVGSTASSVRNNNSAIQANTAAGTRMPQRPRGRIVRAVGRGRGSGVIVGSRPLLPASVVPEELINQVIWFVFRLQQIWDMDYCDQYYHRLWVCHVAIHVTLCRHGWMDRGPAWGGDSWGPFQHCIGWGFEFPCRFNMAFAKLLWSVVFFDRIISTKSNGLQSAHDLYNISRCLCLLPALKWHCTA